MKNPFTPDQSISKYKLLSSNCGIGALIPSKWGGTVLILGFHRWPFFERLRQEVKKVNLNSLSKDPIQRLNELIQKFQETGVPHLNQIVQDPRFLYFLKAQYGYHNLELLISMPDFVSNRSHNHSDVTHENSTIPAIYFPRYFFNSKKGLRLLENWNSTSVPPQVRSEKKLKADEPVDIHRLTQVSLVLICENGHLTEIPWSKYITYKRQGAGSSNLLNLPDCCNHPNLRWTESSTKSEGYGSVFIECLNCKEANKFSLQGINRLTCRCDGRMPWLQPQPEAVGHPTAFPQQNCDQNLAVSLPTANNVYFANTISSLFIPSQQNTNLNSKLVQLIKWFTDVNNVELHEDRAMLSREEFFALKESKIREQYGESNLENLRKSFVGTSKFESPEVLFERYRYEEYQVFTEEPEPNNLNRDDLYFRKIKMPSDLDSYFSDICRVDHLKITSTQLNFSRVTPPKYLAPDETQKIGQSIHQEPRQDVLCLPAIQSSGEGIFIAISESKVSEWEKSYGSRLFADRRSQIFDTKDHFDRERELIGGNREIFFLVHTFSHILMKELEYSCGYPLSSLKERLYVSHRMAGFLIYTTDGSEGGMGGLTSMATPDKIKELVEGALKRTLLCSSDPLCWTNNGAGHASLNLAACFSCCTVSENSCEMRNLGLDRRILSDPEFGFFRKLLRSTRLGQ
jgi:hypothetical protein